MEKIIIRDQKDMRTRKERRPQRKFKNKPKLFAQTPSPAPEPEPEPEDDGLEGC